MKPQATLLDTTCHPSGFHYSPEFLAQAEEDSLLEALRSLTFSAVEMRGVIARRRTLHFGWTYGYYARRTAPGPPLPAFLLPFRERLGEWAHINPDVFVEALITEYPAGAPIGWHRDAPQFGDVIAGLSLAASARMKFRPYVSPDLASGTRRETTHEVELEPRSAYLISGEARRDYEHSIPPVASLRYSITYRTLR